MADPEPRQIDWASAQIKDGTLTVEFTGKGSKAWRARFENVLALLETPHTAWGEVSLHKSAVKVADVQQGAEPELRHFLESVLLQANSDTQPGAPEGDAETNDVGEELEVDEQMTATFRAFAQQQED
ncbi:MAG TPA: hypothetical protein VK781_06610 [Solirubrobacteraceae bacterium]|jgi:hypothetical protein|nr:hypothetical protein [Solirubrobacteraceae bacterium]